jgi:DNA invertase Pin-like site-specific DNA recombinase
MKRCAIYTRTATPDSYPCESQREVCMVFAERQGWAILVEPFDDRLCCGTAGDRGALSRLLARVRAGDVDIVLIWCASRLSRSTSQLLALGDELRGHGAHLVSVSEGELGEQAALLEGALANGASA